MNSKKGRDTDRPRLSEREQRILEKLRRDSAADEERVAPPPATPGPGRDRGSLADKWSTAVGTDEDGEWLRPLQPSPPDREGAAGALLGLAVGDALGTTLEFAALEAPTWPELCRGPHTEMVGGGPFRLAAGQVTDDTQMACCLAASLVERGGFDVEDVAGRYVAWSAQAFDIGSQTRAALSRIAAGQDPRLAGREVWLKSGQRAAGNGSLMRTAPIGVFLATHAQAEARRQASLCDSAITHFDPRCQLACAAFNAALAAGMRRESPRRMAEAARAEIDLAEKQIVAAVSDDEPAVRMAGAALRGDLDAAAADDPQLYGPELHLGRQQGFVRVAFRMAFWHLLHPSSFEQALVDVVNRGGDADTNGAIVGALCGVHAGVGAIPAHWREAVVRAQPADDTSGPPGDAYHPRRLLALADRVFGQGR